MVANSSSGRRRVSSFAEDGHPGGFEEIARENAFLSVVEKKFAKKAGTPKKKKKKHRAKPVGLEAPQALELAQWAFQHFAPGNMRLSHEHSTRLCREVLKMADRAEDGKLTFESFRFWFQRRCQDVAIHRVNQAAGNRRVRTSSSASSSSSSSVGFRSRRSRSSFSDYDPNFRPSIARRPVQLAMPGNDVDLSGGFEAGCVVVDMPTKSNGKSRLRSDSNLSVNSAHSRKGHGLRERKRHSPMVYSGDCTGNPGEGLRPVLTTGASKTSRRRRRKKAQRETQQMQSVFSEIKPVRYSPRGRRGSLGYFKPSAAQTGREGFVMLDEVTLESSSSSGSASSSLSVEEQDRVRQVALVNKLLKERQLKQRHDQLAKRLREHTDPVVLEIFRQQMSREHTDLVTDAARKAASRKLGGSSHRSSNRAPRKFDNRIVSSGRNGRCNQPRSGAFQRGNRVRAS